MKKILLCLAPALLLACSSKIVDPIDEAGPFAVDSGTVLLANFNGDSVNSVTGRTGVLRTAGFAPALFGSGVSMQAGAAGKYWVDFPDTEAFSLRLGIEGSLEALVWADSAQPGYAHIIEKAWQYSISVHDGKLAAFFGTTWWYSQIDLPLGKWSYAAATYDGLTLCLYLNGELVASTPYAGERDSDYTTKYDLAVGNSSSDAYNVPFKGIIDAARVSRTVRSSAEVAAVWAAIAKRIP